jgi:hypothetical protein
MGFIHGTSAEINVELGFVPEYVRISDWTNGNIITEGYMKRVIVFTSLSNAINPGDWIKGITSGAKARIKEIILDSGTVAGGNAAGWLICDAEDISGTLQTENADVYTSEPGSAAASANHLGIVVDTELGVNIAAAVVTATTDAASVRAYVGTDAARRKGFTIGSTVSQDGVLLHYFAAASDQGMGQEPEVVGVKQSDGVW